jgi:hypothetical protein
MEIETVSTPDVITATEAKNILNCSRSYLDVLIQKKVIKPIKTKKLRLYFKKSEIELAKPLLKKNRKS